MTTIHTVLTIATHRDWEIHQVDIKSAYLNATTSTRLDIAFPVTILSQFMHNLGWIHWEAVKDVIRYLKGTADLTLTLGGSAHGLKAYVDADWASQPHRHSMSGYTVLLHSSPVAWMSGDTSGISTSDWPRPP
jgi:hypothetical protein